MSMRIGKTEQLDPIEEEALPGETAPEETMSMEEIDDPGEEETTGEEAETAEEETAGFVLPEEPAKPSQRRSRGRRGHSGKTNRKHRRKNWLLRLVILTGALIVFIMIANLPYFQITEIPVIGNKTVSDEEILELSGIEPGDSILLLNTLRIRGKIKENLYVKEVRINRELPGTVEIIVQEREAAAQFIKKGKNGETVYVITDIDGMVMGQSDKKQKVTMVEGVGVTRAPNGETVKVDETGVYKKAMDLIRTAQEGDVYFKKIQIRGSMVHAYIFDDLICKGRYENLIHALTSGELKSVVYRLYQEDVDEGTINIGENNYCSFTPKK